MKKKLPALIAVLSVLSLTVAQAQPAKLILEQQEGRITFAVDEVEPATSSIGWGYSGAEVAKDLNVEHSNDIFLTSTWESEIIANSFADETGIRMIGEDVVFKMLLEAWCQHRPVVLSPDAIWLVICQQVSYCINKNPEDYRALLVNHEGKKELQVRTAKELFTEKADWSKIISEFTAQIDQYTNNDIASTLVADFSTTGTDERIASQVTLMDAVKSYFDYTVIYAVCGIPSITLTGTPDDWRKVLEKTRALEELGFGWWTSELEPILEEFVKAAAGKPDYWFWKDIVKKSRPLTVEGPSCMGRKKELTKFDGWFLKFFPFDNDGRTPEKVTLVQNMLPETVVVPFKYQIVSATGEVLEETPMELVAGIVGVLEEAKTFTLTPKIGWFVRTAKPGEVIAQERHRQDSIQLANALKTGRALSDDSGLTMDASVKYWDEGLLSLSDLSRRSSEWPEIFKFEYGISYGANTWKVGNTRITAPSSRTFMNPYVSWVHPDYATPQMLQYFQTMFDYVEICRRRAANDFAKGSSFNRDQVTDFHLKVADSFFARMKEETVSGQDTAAVRHYADMVSKELAQTQEASYENLEVYPKGFGSGFYIGGNSEFPVGPIGKYVNPAVQLVLGCSFTVNRVVVGMDVSVGTAGKLKQDLPRDGYKWEAGNRLTPGNVEFTLGYTAYDSQWWKLTPFVGGGLSSIEYPSNPVDADKKVDTLSGFRFMAGVEADYKLFRAIEFNSYMDAMHETSVRARLYVARSAFPVPGPSWSVNLGIGINFLAWLLK